MTRLIGAVMAVALLVSVAPVLAGDSFYALSRLPADLTPLDDAQLATVEGGDVCVDCTNISDVDVDQDAYQSLKLYLGTFVQVAGDDASFEVEQSIRQSSDVRVNQDNN